MNGERPGMRATPGEDTPSPAAVSIATPGAGGHATRGRRRDTLPTMPTRQAQAGGRGTLEQRYRLLLLAYPADYRASRGEEIVATLLDGASPTQTMPTPADAVDILKHAGQRRISPLITAEVDAAVRVAAPWALAIATGISVFAWWRVEPAVPTTGPLAYAFWLAALAGWVILRTPALIGVAILATVLTAPLGAATGMDRPPLWILMSLTTLGGIAFAGHSRDSLTTCAQPTGHAQQGAESRLNTAAAAAAVAFACGLVSPSPEGYYQPVISRVGAVVAAVILATAVAAVHRRRRGRSARVTVFAGLLLALPATWLGPIDLIAWNLPVGDLTAARFGRLAHVVLATCVVLCVIAWCLDNWGVPRRGDAHPRRSTLAGVAVGCAIGYGLFVSLTRFAPHAVATIAVLLGLAVLLRRLPSALVTVSSAVGMLAGSWLIGFYGNNWSATGWADPSRTVVLASMLAIVPCSVVAFATFRARKRITAGAAAAGWICYLSLPALVAWGPLLWALATMIVVFIGRSLIGALRPVPASARPARGRIGPGIGTDDSPG